MAGAAADRQLTRQSALRFALATTANEGEIRRLLRDNPMPGAVRLTFEREPDYLRGVDLAGAEDETIVAFARDRLVCMGRCSRRECWLDGRPVRAGYLAELRLDAAARGQFAILRDGYRFFREQAASQAAEFYFTSIASDNLRARRILERGAKGMPIYGFLAELATLLIAVPRALRVLSLRVERATPEQLPEVLQLLNAHGQRHQLAACWTAAHLCALEHCGLPLDRFLLARDGGKIVACGALWDQRGLRQTVIRGYARGLALARPAVNLAARLFDGLRLPAPGSVLAHAYLSPLACSPGFEAVLPDFVAAFFPLAQRLGLECLTLALPASDPRLTVLRRLFSTRIYRSRLYRVDWSGESPVALENRNKPFLPDVALL